MKLSKKLHTSLPRHICRGFKSGEIAGHCLWADSSRADIVEQHVVQCAQSHVHLTESAAPSGRSRLQSSVNCRRRNYQKIIIVCKTIITKISSQWCRWVKLILPFRWNKWELVNSKLNAQKSSTFSSLAIPK